MSHPLRTALCFVSVVAAAAACLWPSRAQSAAPRPEPAVGGTRGPSDLCFSPDGSVLYVAEQDENQVAVMDPATGRVLARIPTGGTQPTGIALMPDGKTLLAVNSFSGSVGILDLEKRELRGTIALPGMPYDVAVAPGGEAFVSVSQLNEVAVLDVPGARVTARIRTGVKPVGRFAATHTGMPPGSRPRALALTPDGKTLLCGSLSNGSLSMIDVATRTENAAVLLSVVNARGVAVSADGKTAYVTGQQPNPSRSTERPEETWKNQVRSVLVNGGELAHRLTLELDGPAGGAADPTGIAVVSEGDRDTLYVVLAGTHEVCFVRPGQSRSEETRSTRIPVGANPRAIVRRPGSTEVWVANHLGNSLSVIDTTSQAVSRTVALDAPGKSDIRLRGRYLFNSAHATRGMGFTCNSCHPDGNTDGLAWNFSHITDGIEVRSSRNLRGALLLTAPYRWVPRETDYEEFVQDEVVGLLQGRKLPHRELHALWDLVNDLPMPPNPYRSPEGSLTPAAIRGKALFAGKADCVSCHGGDQHGGTGKRGFIGTTPNELALDVPHLTGVYDSAPYLHDARARTLEAVFTDHNTSKRHGKAHLLNAAELQDLLEYVRQL